MNLGGLPVILDIFVVVVVLVRVFAFVDRLADRVLAQLHPLRRNGRRASGISSSPRRTSVSTRA